MCLCHGKLLSWAEGQSVRRTIAYSWTWLRVETKYSMLWNQSWCTLTCLLSVQRKLQSYFISEFFYAIFFICMLQLLGDNLRNRWPLRLGFTIRTIIITDMRHRAFWNNIKHTCKEDVFTKKKTMSPLDEKDYLMLMHLTYQERN